MIGAPLAAAFAQAGDRSFGFVRTLPGSGRKRWTEVLHIGAERLGIIVSVDLDQREATATAIAWRWRAGVGAFLLAVLGVTALTLGLLHASRQRRATQEEVRRAHRATNFLSTITDNLDAVVSVLSDDAQAVFFNRRANDLFSAEVLASCWMRADMPRSAR